jgi:hypothetical protein
MRRPRARGSWWDGVKSRDAALNAELAKSIPVAEHAFHCHMCAPVAPVMPVSMLQSLPYAVFVESAGGDSFPLLRSHMCARVLLLCLCAYILLPLHTAVHLDCTARQSVPLIMTHVCTCAHPAPMCTFAVITVRCVCGVGRRGQLGCHQHEAAAG